MDVIVNKDLTKKVLAALNPNKIFDEDQLEKQLAVVRSQRPFGESEEEVIKQSKNALDKEIAKKPLPSLENFNLEYLNSIEDKDEFLKFIDTIYAVYPKIPNRNDAEYLFKIMDQVVKLYQNKFTRIPYSSEQLNSDNFDRLFELKEELRKKLYPGPSFKKRLGTAATATGQAIGTAATATGQAASRAATATGQAASRAATATGQAIGTAATATGRAASRVASATGQAVGTAASATGRAARSAASATGQAVGTAARATRKAVGTAASATRKRAVTAALQPESPEPIVQGRPTGPMRQQPRVEQTNQNGNGNSPPRRVGFQGNNTRKVRLLDGRYPARNKLYSTVKPSQIGTYNTSREAKEYRKSVRKNPTNMDNMNVLPTVQIDQASRQRRKQILNKLKKNNKQFLNEGNLAS